MVGFLRLLADIFLVPKSPFAARIADKSMEEGVNNLSIHPPKNHQYSDKFLSSVIRHWISCWRGGAGGYIKIMIGKDWTLYHYVFEANVERMCNYFLHLQIQRSLHVE